MVKAECKASAEADANFNAECTPPKVSVGFKLDASLEGAANADAQAELGAQLEAFGKAFGKLQGLKAKLSLLTDAGSGLLASADGAVKSGAEAVVSADADFLAAFQAACAIEALPEATKMLTDSGADVTECGMAVGTVTSAVGG
jgi:hypothetical protein